MNETFSVVKEFSGAVLVKLTGKSALNPDGVVAAIVASYPAATRIFFEEAGGTMGELVHNGQNALKLAGISPATTKKYFS